MIMICNKSEIYEAIINVSKAVSDKTTIQALEGIKLKLENGVLELTGYDLELGIKTRISVKSDDRGEFIIDARHFSEMLKKMPTEEVLINVMENLIVK
ncbi:MAG: DNA polymerase III subunit beta, partial [Clostridiales bacterium]|nr:DNA polymerase III subunit beta [Clostridiales bacterium]